MDAVTRIGEIRRALISLGYEATIHFVAVELDDTRARVTLDGSTWLGVYDFVKHTFVD